MKTQLDTSLAMRHLPFAGPKNTSATGVRQPLAKPVPAAITFGERRDIFSRSGHSKIAAGQKAKLPKTLKRTIEAAATELYGKEKAPEVSRNIEAIIQQARKNRPEALLKEDYQRPADWYKQEHAYMLYPERFGTENGKPTTFKQLVPMLGYLKNMGVSTLYLLPFMKSPMIDAGFDISDYKQVREELGGNEEFDTFMAEARKKGMKVKADLVLNHVSDQHPWFQAALKGDPDKLNYFLYRDKVPDSTMKATPKDGTWITYKEDDGSSTKRRLIFPEISSTHYRKDKVNGKDKHFYYTFYPHQVDLNWKNPKVLYEALDVMGHWANKGVDIFRLDALPFFVKPPNSTGENTKGTHAVIQLLSASLQAMSPRSVLWAEACQKPDAIKPYFGKEHAYGLSVPGQGPKMMKRTDKVQLAYHFPQMTALWASMITKDPKVFWNTMKDTPKLPDSAEWASFLRVHDEMTMEMFDNPKLKAIMQETLSKRGESFRGGEGIGGRVASFLDHDPKRIQQAQSILYSMPGLPLQYYGDEIGESNSPEFMRQAAVAREQQAAKSGAATRSLLDARDTGRAPISKERLFKAMNEPDSHEGQIFHHVKRLIEVRKQEPALSKGTLTRVPSDQTHVFSYLRQTGKQQVLIVNNLADEQTTARLNLPEQVKAKKLPADGVMDLQSGKPVAFTAPSSSNRSDNAMNLTLKPYESMWLKIPEAASRSESSRHTRFSDVSAWFKKPWRSSESG